MEPSGFEPTTRVGRLTRSNAQCIFTHLRPENRKMVEEKVLEKSSSYLIPQTVSTFLHWFMSYPRLKMVYLTCKPYGLVGF